MIAFWRLSRRDWVHPARGGAVRFSVSTIERWYYQARSAGQDPVRALRRRVRRDDSDCSLGFLLGCQLARPVPGRNSTAFEMGASP